MKELKFNIKGTCLYFDNLIMAQERVVKLAHIYTVENGASDKRTAKYKKNVSGWINKLKINKVLISPNDTMRNKICWSMTKVGLRNPGMVSTPIIR